MAQPKLSQKSLNGIPIPFPDEKQRRRIVTQAKVNRKYCDALKENYQAQTADVAALRQSLLQRAFSGQLT
jgi:type I restriction enzyme S subunit